MIYHVALRYFSFGRRFRRRSTSNLLLQTRALSPCPPSWTTRYINFFLLTPLLVPSFWQSIFSTLVKLSNASTAFFDRPCLILGHFLRFLMMSTGGSICPKISKWHHEQHANALNILYFSRLYLCNSHFPTFIELYRPPDRPLLSLNIIKCQFYRNGLL